ncbi:hypothetical protein [Streptomyces sp. NPDC021020]|uniref:hypothetical protein n=1 Tax=Streptomyces sp. NPDC021020 TaxID=3365109 RepID=UPI00379D7506
MSAAESGPDGPDTTAATSPAGAPPSGPRMPAFPALAGFGSLGQRLGALGFRHAVDPMLRAPQVGQLPPMAGAAAQGPTFRVLDGLWISGRGGHWLRVDAAFVNDCRKRWEASAEPRADAIRSVLAWLRRHTAGDAMHLRRVVLYQLSCLLADEPGGPTAAAAEQLGVDPAESALLAATVAAGFPAPGPVREAAETFPDVVRERRLHRAAELARVLRDGDAGADTDPVLADALADLRRRTAEVDALVGAAAERGRAGALESAGTAWLGAARLSVDDPRARAGLLGLAAARADAAPDDATEHADGPLTARLDEDEVALDWQPVRTAARRRGPVRYAAFRFPEGAPEQAVEVPATGDGATARDTDVPTGVLLRYAVLALNGDRVVELPYVCSVLLCTPEVARLSWKAVPDGVALSWRAHPRAAAVQVVRGTEPPVPGGQSGLLDRPLPPGDHWYRVSTGYRAPDGALVWSRGRTVSARAEEWPTPVPDVRVRRVLDDGRVEIAWSPPARGADRLVAWRTWRAAPGEDVSALLDRLPRAEADVAVEDGPDAARRVMLRPAEGEVNRMTVVSVLGGLAVAGPTVLIEVPRPVTGLTVRRTGPGAARVRFGWPEPAVLALVRWEQGGRVREQRVARSRMGADGVEIALDGRAATVTVNALPRPDAAAVAGGSARESVPAVPVAVAAPPVPPPPGHPPEAVPHAVDAAPAEPAAWWRRAPRRLREWVRARRGHR